MKYKLLFLSLFIGTALSLFGVSKTYAYQSQLNFGTGKAWTQAVNQGVIWKNWNGLSANNVAQIQLALANGDANVQWKICLANRALQKFPCSQPITVTSSNFYTFTFAPTSTLAENDVFYFTLSCISGKNVSCGYSDYAWHLDIFGSNQVNASTTYYGGDPAPVKAYYFQLFTKDDIPTPFAITSPQNNDPEIRDTWITVSGTCPIAGVSRIGLTNDCSGFNKINYNISCTSSTFSSQFYYNGLGDKRIIARDASSTATDCVDYDNLMDYKTVRNIEVINGYPNQWYANLDYYQDYNIIIKSPTFDTALTLPAGSTSSLFTFRFTYPASSTLANLQFTIKQYDPNGVLLNGNYHSKVLNAMANTQNYPVVLAASSTTPLHYVVQLTDSGQMKRQYPFAIYVSDLVFIANPDQTAFFFPRLVELLKTKVVFNYFFAFHDGFYNLFNGTGVAASANALDITLKSVSDNKKYNTNILIFSASDPTVKSFSDGLRPYITAILWLLFALYVVLRVSRLYSNSNQ